MSDRPTAEYACPQCGERYSSPGVCEKGHPAAAVVQVGDVTDTGADVALNQDSVDSTVPAAETPAVPTETPAAVDAPADVTAPASPPPAPEPAPVPAAPVESLDVIAPADAPAEPAPADVPAQPSPWEQLGTALIQARDAIEAAIGHHNAGS